MTTSRERLIDRMVALYGFESPIVIEFVKLCENWAENEWNNLCLRIAVEAHEANPYYEED